MTLNWHQSNLETHVARHFIGDLYEDWRSLLGPSTAAQWDGWVQAAGACRCRVTDHPAQCRNAAACVPVHQAASAPYADLAAADWAFAENRDFLVRYVDEKGKPCLCGAGPRGIFVAVAYEANGSRMAKTAFRPIERAKHGNNRTLGAVRKMKDHASLGTGGWSVNDLVRLETLLLLGPRGRGEPRLLGVATDLTATPAQDLP